MVLTSYDKLEGSGSSRRCKVLGGVAVVAVLAVAAVATFATLAARPNDQPGPVWNQDPSWQVDVDDYTATFAGPETILNLPRDFPEPQGTSELITVDDREVEVYTPHGVEPNENTCLVVVYHGVTSNPADIELKMRFKPHVDTNPAGCSGGWLLAYPNGGSIVPSWNGAGCCPLSNLDDVAHTKNIIDRLVDEGKASRTNVFLSGFSNGAFLVHRLACTLGLREDGHPWVRAIVPHSGLMGNDERTQEECASLEQSMPILSFHGVDDSIVQYDGTVTLIGKMKSFLEVMATYAELNDCKGEPDVKDRGADTTTCKKFTDCAASPFHETPVTVEFCSVYVDEEKDPEAEDGLGHNWSGMYSNRDDLQATEMTFNFFASHVRE